MAVLSLDSDPATVREVREAVEGAVEGCLDDFRDELDILGRAVLVLTESVETLRESVAMLVSLAEVAEANRP